MNIKDLGNYELVNGNTDSPILIGTPTFYNFSIQTKGAFNPTSTRPMFDIETQVEMKGDLSTLIYDTAVELNQADDGCGHWWYITDIKSEYINKIGVAEYFMVLSATVIVVRDRNFPSQSPSNV
jgi:hypothetical protein